MTFEFAREEEYLRLPHFLTQLLRIQVTEKLDILAVRILRQFPARVFSFARSGQPELPLRKSGCLLHDQIRTLVGSERAGKQNAPASGTDRRLRAWIIIAAVDAIVDDIYILTAQFAHRFCHVAAVGGEGVAFPHGSPQNWAFSLLACFEPSGYDIRHQRRPQAQFRTSG